MTSASERCGSVDRSEELAFQYLSSLGLSPIIYEPDGNVPPDFVADGRIGVEVRRLNQHEPDESGKARGLEHAQFALLRSIPKILSSLGPPAQGRSWFVHYSFSRPIPTLTKLRRSIRDVLEAFRDGQLEGKEFLIADRFTLHLIPSSKVYPDCFVPGGFGDDDAGGWLIQELEKNIQICIREKSAKIANMRAKYPEWWLVLIDFIGYGAQEPLSIKHDWDKVILVNPLDPQQGFEV